jgi:hypothetical protein
MILCRTRRPSWLWPRTAFWVVRLQQQLTGPLQVCHFGLELADAFVRRGQFGLLGSVQAGELTGVD